MRKKLLPNYWSKPAVSKDTKLLHIHEEKGVTECAIWHTDWNFVGLSLKIFISLQWDF
jgi:hypothetical protein